MNTFAVEPVSEKDLPDVRDFLTRYEFLCTALTALFVRRRTQDSSLQFFLPRSGTCSLVRLKKKTGKDFLIGVLYISPCGLVYHCLPFFEKNAKDFFFGTEDSFAQLKHLLSNVFKNVPISSIVGSAPASLFLENCFNRRAKEYRTYKLMKLITDSRKAAEYGDLSFAAPQKNISILRCLPEHGAALFPLIKAYYEEEVFSAYVKTEEDVLRRLFAGKLKTQIILGLTVPPGFFAATAGTAAIGMRYAQLGGVYTIPAFRRRGFACLLVSRLCTELQKNGYTPVLFTDTKNTAAYSLYTSCGFSVCGDYRIAYF
ncbi:GNAT family N-acetyltransferase [Treponema sp. OMZ 840]|uniref:GNAT family N-acetyltransferase n=1 Tax=Treponema sp. OMZ 840 TaxID=244313 RepID=UPI003D945D16